MLSVGFLQLAKQLIRTQTVSAQGTRAAADLLQGLWEHAGLPVRFVVTNSGATDHEFFLGDEAAQMGHGQEMSAMPGMNDGHAGIGLKAGETKILEYTFAKAGPYLAGCHISGHYAAGMMATITVTE